MEQTSQPHTPQRKLSAGRPRAQSTSEVELTRVPRPAEATSLGNSRSSIFSKQRGLPRKSQMITEGLIDFDQTLKLKDNYNCALLFLLDSKNVVNLCLFTKMRTFKIFTRERIRTEDIGTLLERLHGIMFVENFVSRDVKVDKKLHVPCVITSQDFTLHIPYAELRAFIKAEETYVDRKQKEALLMLEEKRGPYLEHVAALKKGGHQFVRKVMLDEARDAEKIGNPNPYSNIEALRQSLEKGTFIKEQFSVGMAFAFALCQLYGHHVAGDLELPPEELKTIKSHLKKMIERTLRGTEYLQNLLAKKYDADFKLGKTFMQIIHMGDYPDYSYDDHMDYAQKVSDSLVDFCTDNPNVAKILMFSQYVRCKPANVGRVVVAEDREEELLEIEKHPWARSSEPSPVIRLYMTGIPREMTEAELTKQFDAQTLPATRSANVSPAVTPPKSPKSSGSDEDEKGKDNLGVSRGSLLAKLRLKSKASSSTDDSPHTSTSTPPGLKKKHPTMGNSNN